MLAKDVVKLTQIELEVGQSFLIFGNQLVD